MLLFRTLEELCFVGNLMGANSHSNFELLFFYLSSIRFWTSRSFSFLKHPYVRLVVICALVWPESSWVINLLSALCILECTPATSKAINIYYQEHLYTQFEMSSLSVIRQELSVRKYTCQQRKNSDHWIFLNMWIACSTSQTNRMLPQEQHETTCSPVDETLKRERLKSSLISFNEIRNVEGSL